MLRTAPSRYWEVPTLAIRDIVRGKKITLLKIDIDTVEGKLLHTVERAIARGETSVETILIELGDKFVTYKPETFEEDGDRPVSLS